MGFKKQSESWAMNLEIKVSGMAKFSSKKCNELKGWIEFHYAEKTGKWKAIRKHIVNGHTHAAVVLI